MCLHKGTEIICWKDICMSLLVSSLLKWARHEVNETLSHNEPRNNKFFHIKNIIYHSTLKNMPCLSEQEEWSWRMTLYPGNSSTEWQCYLYEKSKTVRHKGLPAWLPPVILGGEQQILTKLTRSSISMRWIRASAELYAIIPAVNNGSAQSVLAVPWYHANPFPKCVLVQDR